VNISGIATHQFNSQVDARLEELGLLNRDFITLKVHHVAPKKPRKGQVVYADGTNWDPGSGEGLYVYKAGWIFIA
jgi:hypothetical protein